MAKAGKIVAGAVVAAGLALALPYWWVGRQAVPLDDAVRAQAPGGLKAFIGLPEGKLYARWDGPEGGPVAVMIHGFSQDSGVFDRNAPALAAAGFRVLRMDNWGRGWSDRPDARHDVELFDRQILGGLDALGLTQPVDVVGLSMGGAIAVAFTVRHPDRVRRLALIAPAGLPFERPFSARLVTWPGAGAWVMRVFGRGLLLGGEAHPDAKIQAEMLANIEPAMRHAGYLDGLASTLRHYPLNGLEADYARIGSQGRLVLLVWGDQDSTVPFHNAPKAAELLKAKLVTLAGATHAVNMEKAAEVNASLVAFLKE